VDGVIEVADISFGKANGVDAEQIVVSEGVFYLPVEEVADR